MGSTLSMQGMSHSLSMQVVDSYERKVQTSNKRRFSRTEATLQLWEMHAGDGRRLEDFYENPQKLGEGAYGTVSRWQLKSGTPLGGGTPAKPGLPAWARSSPSKDDDVSTAASPASLRSDFTTSSRSSHSSFGSAASGATCFAVKQLNWQSIWKKAAVRREREAAIRQELTTLIGLDHPNIALIREWFEDRQAGFFFVMELCEGGSLQDYLEERVCAKEAVQERLDCVPNLQRCFRDLAYAVSYIHSRGVVHRDLKPENVMFKSKRADSSVKLIDFGLAALAEGEGEGEAWQQGTMLFMAPELFLKCGGRFTEKSDMWSMGVILAWVGSALMSGTLQHPMLVEDDGRGFAVEQYDLFCTYRARETPHEEFLEGMPVVFVTMVLDLLRYDPDERVSAQECLKNAWVAEGDASLNAAGGTLSAASTCEALGHMLGWSRLGASHRSLLSLVTANCTDADVNELTRAFEAFDVRKTGQVTKMDFIKILQGWRGGTISEAALEQLCKRMAASGLEAIDYHEWLCANISHTTLSRTSLARAFASLDSTNSGKLQSPQLRRVVGQEAASSMVRRHSRKGTPSLYIDDFGKVVEEICDERDRAPSATSSFRQSLSSALEDVR